MTDVERDAESATLAGVADGDEEEALLALSKVRTAGSPLVVSGAILGAVGAYLIVRVGVAAVKGAARGPQPLGAIFGVGGLFPEAFGVAGFLAKWILGGAGAPTKQEELLTADPLAIGVAIYTGGSLLAGQNPLTGIGEVLKGIGEIVPL